MKKKLCHEIISLAKSKLECILKKAGVPDSHGMGHCSQVLQNMEKTLENTKKILKEERKLSLKLGALLHDADDRKYFPKTSKNGEKIIKECLTKLDPLLKNNKETSEITDNHKKQKEINKKKLTKKLNFKNNLETSTILENHKKIIEETLQMINMVSASKNGNKIPEIAKKEPEYLWVRFCDRLEAIGIIGAIRCYQYTMEKGNPLFGENTPRPTNKKELWSFVKSERFDKYQTDGKSESMMDHYYDKLLQIAKFDENVVQNDFLIQEAERRVEPLIDICIEFGKTGKIPEKILNIKLN